MASPMNGQEMFELLREITDGLVEDETVGLALINVAKDELENLHRLQMLKAFDSSQTASPSDTYLTPKSLPSDFMEDVTLYVGDDRTPWNKVDFSLREQYRDVTRFWYIDHASGTFSLCGRVPSTMTIKMFYKKSTPDITLLTSPVWPASFHKLIPIRAAESAYMADGGELPRSWDSKWAKLAERLEDGLLVWDAHLKVSAMESNVAAINPNGIPDAVFS